MIEEINIFLKNNFNSLKLVILIIFNLYLIYEFYEFNYNHYLRIINKGWKLIIAYMFSWIIFKIFLVYFK